MSSNMYLSEIAIYLQITDIVNVCTIKLVLQLSLPELL
jgi:hypothetical protein